MTSKKPKQPTFKYTPSVLLPDITIQTEWDLKKHYYSSETDPQIEIDIKAIESTYSAFAKKFAGKDFTSTVDKLAAALKAQDALMAIPASKPILYYWYRQTLDASDQKAEQQINLISERLTKTGNQTIFFGLAIAKIPKATQKLYLKDPKLEPYRYLLSQIFETAKHNLTEAEEKIMSLKSTPARSLWVNGTDKILNKRSITYKKQVMPLNEAIEKVSAIDPVERPKLWAVVREELKSLSEIAENEMNAIVIDKKINDELRGYTKPYQATVQSYENDLTAVEALVESISTKGFALSRKFYELKAKAHGVASLPYASKYDPMGEEIHIPFSDAADICRDVFYGVKNEYGEFFDEMLKGGNIDVYPRKNRSGGAFMSSDTNIPIFVFLNQVDTFKSLETLAHEMGHALHSHRSKAAQPARYQDYSTTTAETASTLFENLVFDSVYRQSDDATRFTLMHDRLTRDISTIQRQIAFFNFEREMHMLIRTQGAASKEELAALLVKQLKAHLGKGVDVADDDGYSFVYIGHFRAMFYVYSYAYGLLMSSLMSQNYIADNSYAAQIDKFLTSGGNNTVENIFKSIGIDAHKLSTFETSLASLEKNVNEFGRLLKKRGK
jgi:oligoendopeptidase F